VGASNPWPEESAFPEAAVLALDRPTTSNTMAVSTLKVIKIKGRSNTFADSIALTLGSVSWLVIHREDGLLIWKSAPFPVVRRRGASRVIEMIHRAASAQDMRIMRPP